jgi:undecaprenyl-phosphate 4-deoxy-4-formamido-L-arabinose transferase
LVEKIKKYDGPYPYIDGLIFRFTSNISELEIQHYNRFAGKGSYTLYKSISLWLRVLTNFSIIPLRFSTYVGIISSFVGFLLGLYFIGAHFLGLESPEGWPSLIVAILFIGGIQLLGLGIIGEYVGRSFLYQSKEPQFIIEEITQKDN